MIHTHTHTDTIAALATPNGRGGIAVIKLSGTLSLPIALTIFKSLRSPRENPRSMIYGHVYDDTELVDEALLCFMPSPGSYTGEDVVEIQTHGGFAVAHAVLSLLNKAGSRPAEPGEFTRRAFLNGRIDLVQAESVMEVVYADTREQLRQAERLLDGQFSRRLAELLELMTTGETLLTLNIDFPDHVQGEIHHKKIQQSLKSCISLIDSFLQSATIGRRLHDGISVILTGPVNSGKSSLFNTLLGRKRSLVNIRPGTTRDWIEERIELEGLPVNLIDTAGLRETADEVELDGIMESRRIIEKADIVVQLVDPLAATSPCPLQETCRFIQVYSKSDLVSKSERTEEKLYISTVTGEGISRCTEGIVHLARELFSLPDSLPPLMIERHRDLFENARAHTGAAIAALEQWSEEISAFELRNARETILKITGKIVDTDILDTVFRTFCIGK